MGWLFLGQKAETFYQTEVNVQMSLYEHRDPNTGYCESDANP